jgi:hypothetical protein
VTQPDGQDQGEQDDREGAQAGQPPPGPRRVQPSPRRRRQAEKQADSGRHGECGQPVAPLHLDPTADGGHVREDKEQLESEDGLDQGQRPEAQRADLEDEPEDHAGQAKQPDRAAGQPEDEPDVNAGHLAALGPEALAHRGRGRAEACGQG